jgi:hypothetical protein
MYFKAVICRGNDEWAMPIANYWSMDISARIIHNIITHADIALILPKITIGFEYTDTK